MTTDVYPVSPAFAEQAFVTPSSYLKDYDRSITEPEAFWAEQAHTYITWEKEWSTVLMGSFDQQDVKWFVGGKLNASINCLDRHLEKRGTQKAIIWEGDDPADRRELTYAELHREVNQFANVLKKYDVKKGDRVCIYMPLIPEAIVAMLACARIGAVHSVVFGGFSAESIKTRILDADCRVVITANEGLRAGKMIPLKKNVDLALEACPLVRRVIVVKRTDSITAMQPSRDSWYHEAMQGIADICDPEIMDALDPLFVLYTSGSTGTPKGILHGTGGYLVYAAMTHKLVFDYHDDEIFWCTADVGWITGHTYGVYGPLSNGATILLFEGVPTYPTPARYWEMIDRYKVNVFYTAPTAIRALRREGDAYVTQTKRTSLRVLGSVGEPINPEAWNWYYHVVGEARCPIVDTWWQTETGGIMVSALPGATALKPGSAALPFFGVQLSIVDDENNPVTDGVMGRLVINKPWPGMFETVYHNRERFIAGYFRDVPGCYLTGDLAMRDKDGYYWIAGRSDDVIKVSGHRIGTGEVESALVLNTAVAEAAVVGREDAIKGQSIYAFVTLKADQQPSDALKLALKQTVREAIGALAIPEHIQWVTGLPKTRSGKIMRRVLRKIVNHDGKEMGDLSTLADPDVVTIIKKAFEDEDNK